MEKIGSTDNGKGVLVKMSCFEWGQIEHLRETAEKAFGAKLETKSFGDLTPLFRAIDRWVSGGFYLLRLQEWLAALEETLISNDETTP